MVRLHRADRLDGAYSGEVIRGAIQQVATGQVEAGRSLGLTKWQIRRFVVLPLAFRQVIPVLANETVLLLKASAIVFTITVQDIMGAANILRAQTFRVYEPLLSAALLYLLLTFLIRRLFALLERRANRHLARRRQPAPPARPLPIQPRPEAGARDQGPANQRSDMQDRPASSFITSSSVRVTTL